MESSAEAMLNFSARRELFPSAASKAFGAAASLRYLSEAVASTVHRRHARPLFLHQSFIEYANESIRHSLWARAFYQMQKAAQKTHWVIIRALAYKWIRILFRCRQERVAYDELRYLKSLQKKRLTLLHYLAKPATNAT